MTFEKTVQLVAYVTLQQESVFTITTFKTLCIMLYDELFDCYVVY